MAMPANVLLVARAVPPGVKVGEGAVVGARAVVVKEERQWPVVALGLYIRAGSDEARRGRVIHSAQWYRRVNRPARPSSSC